MAPTQSLLFQKKCVESPLKLMRVKNGGIGDTERGKWLLWIVKINKHVWAYSSQFETPQWEPFLAESQQEMKDDLTLNTCVGTYHLSFPIMGGQNYYDVNSWGGAASLCLCRKAIYKCFEHLPYTLVVIIEQKLSCCLWVHIWLNLNVPLANINTAIFTNTELSSRLSILWVGKCGASR